MTHLQAINPPIGCTKFINSQQQVKLILKEKILSLTGDAFDVQLDPQNGQPPYPIFKVDPSFITSRKSFYDMQGTHLFDLKKEHFHLIHTYFKAVDPQGNKFFEVKSGFSIVGSKATATFTSAHGKEETLVVKGNWRDSVAEIMDQSRGVVVAQIHRKSMFSSFSTFATGQNTYSLTVAPGVDFALMAALCIAFDELNNEPSA
ncbi:Protein LURP-one-related 10 [Cytospora mali]|uniref:Protein LURP-one-related 10 n=1 Tax=Cytospora mali TaxID=578113 RepID=A0A194V5J6_CYTMA|nr:Protein LURP-one-related 10 [Valsa mali var. pyri (nom. inval.)]